MKHTVPHDLPPDLARKAADRAWESYRQRFSQYSPTATWTTDRHADIRFSVKGFTLKGRIDLEPRGISMDLDVPLPLRIFKKRAIDIIEREIRKWVDKARAGELE